MNEEVRNMKRARTRNWGVGWKVNRSSLGNNRWGWNKAEQRARLGGHLERIRGKKREKRERN